MPLWLAQFNSGKLHNAIPRDGSVVFAVPFDEKERVRVDWNIYCSEVEDEFHVTEQSIAWNMESTEKQLLIPYMVGEKIVRVLQALDNGVFSIVQDDILGDITETSSNLASVCTDVNRCVITCSQRSSVMSNLENMVNTVRSVFELAGADSITHSDGYPAWKMRTDSHLRDVAVECYKELFGKVPKVIGIHAGLECGILSDKIPNLDCVSFGPTNYDIHTPKERLSISSTERYWNFLVKFLEEAK